MEKLPPKVQQYIKQIDDLQKTYASILSQKQQLQMTLLEVKNALEALDKVSDEGEVYKLVGSIFFKTKKKDVVSELKENKEILEARIKTLELQEKKIVEELNKLRAEVTKYLTKPSS